MPNPWDDLPDAPQAAAANPWDDLPDAPSPSAPAPAAAAPVAPPELDARQKLQAQARQARGLPPAYASGTPEAADATGQMVRHVLGLLATGLTGGATQALGPATRIAAMAAAGAGSSLAAEPFDPTPNGGALDRAKDAALGSGAFEGLGSAVGGGLGMAQRYAPQVKQMAQDQIGKALGYIASSTKKGGLDEMRRVAQAAYDNGVVGWLNGPENMLARANAVQAESGARLGEIRNAVDQASPGAPVGPILKRVKQDLGAGITPGTDQAAALEQHLGSSMENVKAFSRAGAKDAPVVGPEGDKDFWKMTRDDIAKTWQTTPKQAPGAKLAITREDMARNLTDHRKAVARAIIDGQNVPAAVLKDYPELKPLFPKQMNASALADAKKYTASKAYQNAQQRPETLGGTLAPRDEVVRANLQQAENELIARVLPDRAGEFQNQKDVYGAMERLTNPKAGATEARAVRDFGNNQIFGATPMMGSLIARSGGEGVGGTGLTAALMRLAYLKGNQGLGIAGQGLSRGLARLPDDPTSSRLAAQAVLQGLGLANPRGDRRPEQP